MRLAAIPENDRSPNPKPIIRDADPTLKRDRLLQRVRAARRQLSRVSGTIPRVQ